MKFEHFHTFAKGEKIVSMLNYKDTTLVATDKSIYVIKDGKIRLMEFEVAQELAKQ